jgi:uncharacterized protein
MGSLNINDLPGGRTLSLDTVTLVYFLERHPAFYPTVREIFRKIEENSFKAVISSLVFAELLVPAYRLDKPEEATRLLQVLTNFPNLEIVPLTTAIAAEAARLRAVYGLRTPDAIHLATAIERGAAGFITNDKNLQRLQGELPVWMIG